MKIDEDEKASGRALWPDRLADWLKPHQGAGPGSAGEPGGATDGDAPLGPMIVPPPPVWPRVFPSL